MIQLISVKALLSKYKTLQEKINHGFTLIELLVVIAIIAVLVGIVVVAIDPVALIGRSNDTKDRSDAQQIKNALQLYFNDFGNYPSVTDFDSVCAPNCLTPDFMRVLPDVFGSGDAVYADDNVSPVPAGEYRVGYILDQPSTQGNDDGTYDKCGGSSDIPTGTTWDDADYFICPD